MIPSFLSRIFTWGKKEEAAVKTNAESLFHTVDSSTLFQQLEPGFKAELEKMLPLAEVTAENSIAAFVKAEHWDAVLATFGPVVTAWMQGYLSKLAPANAIVTAPVPLVPPNNPAAP